MNHYPFSYLFHFLQFYSIGPLPPLQYYLVPKKIFRGPEMPKNEYKLNEPLNIIIFFSFFRNVFIIAPSSFSIQFGSYFGPKKDLQWLKHFCKLIKIKRAHNSIQICVWFVLQEPFSLPTIDQKEFRPQKIFRGPKTNSSCFSHISSSKSWLLTSPVFDVYTICLRPTPRCMASTWDRVD